MLADRRAAVDVLGLPPEEGLELESQSGQATAARGAARFATGDGRGGQGAALEHAEVLDTWRGRAQRPSDQAPRRLPKAGGGRSRGRRGPAGTPADARALAARLEGRARGGRGGRADPVAARRHPGEHGFDDQPQGGRGQDHEHFSRGQPSRVPPSRSHRRRRRQSGLRHPLGARAGQAPPGSHARGPCRAPRRDLHGGRAAAVRVAAPERPASPPARESGRELRESQARSRATTARSRVLARRLRLSRGRERRLLQALLTARRRFAQQNE